MMTYGPAHSSSEANMKQRITPQLSDSIFEGIEIPDDRVVSKQTQIAKRELNGWYEKNSARLKDEKYREEQAERIRNAVKNIDRDLWHKKHMATINDPEWRKKNKQRTKERWSDPLWVKNYYENLEKLKETPEFKESIQRAKETRIANEEWRKNIAEARRKQAKDPNWKETTFKAYHEFFNSPEGKKLRKATGEKNKNNPQFKRNVLIGRGVLPFHTPWGYYEDANVAAEDSKTKNTDYFFETRSTNKTYCCPAKVRKLLKDPKNKDFYFISWDEYDNFTK